MNSRGQVFSVFQLLISAIVAFAILYILLYIIGSITPPGTDPGTTAKSMIKDRLQSPYVFDVSEAIVRFDRGTGLGPRAVAEGTGIAGSQICIFTKDYAENPDFLFRGRALYFEGTAGIDTRISVICGKADELESILVDDFGMEISLDGEIRDDYACGSSCVSGVDRPSTCCAIMLESPR